MIFYVTILRALAACIITNSHYVGIYPTDIIANGGLLGDVIFFAVSGYCLYNVKLTFPRWYLKRMWRLYPPVLIITVVYLMLGMYSLQDHSILYWFIYPTCYHFIASIVVLYIPYYFCVKIKWTRDHLIAVMCIIAVLWIAVYFFAYDKSYYHIDTVREPMVWFLYMESMLLGAWFKKNDSKVRNRFSIWQPIVTLGAVFVYIISKYLFSHNKTLASYQIINQIVIFVLLACIFRTFAGLDAKLVKLPKGIKKVAEFIASITLEIYVVQNVLITILSPIGYFPINWIVLSFSIVVSAYLLHMICLLFYRVVERGMHMQS